MTQSQQYPDEMVRCILRGIRKTAQLRDPERFSRHRALTAEVNRDPEQRAKIFEWVLEVFQRTSNRTFLVPHSDRIWKAVAKVGAMAEAGKDSTCSSTNSTPISNTHPAHSPRMGPS